MKLFFFLAMLTGLLCGCHSTNVEDLMASEMELLRSELPKGSSIETIKESIKENGWSIALEEGPDQLRFEIPKEEIEMYRTRIVGWSNHASSTIGQESAIRFILYFDDLGILTERKFEKINTFL